ncbi:MAG: hypothetical protein WCF95_06675 [bacterium]
MIIQPQNQNFGAIKIKGIKAQSDAAVTVMLQARHHGKDIEMGQTEKNEFFRYVQTRQGSKKEFDVVAALKKALYGTGARVTKCSDNEAAENIKRFNA